MRLFHVSEEPDIKVFEPRLPTRKDLNQNIGLVWAIDEARLPNFLTPRDSQHIFSLWTLRCCCNIVPGNAVLQSSVWNSYKYNTDSDKKHFFSSSRISHAIVIESKWYQTVKNVR